MRNELIKNMIKLIEENYQTGAIGISLYKELMANARELQVTE